MAIKVLLRGARASFVELGAPDYYQGKKQRENDKRRRSCTFICTPETQAKIDGEANWGPAKAVIDRAIQQMAAEEWKDKASLHLSNILPDPKGCCFQDGNRKEYEGYQGNWVLTAHRTEDKGRPLVLDADKTHLYGHELPDGTWRMTDTPAAGKEGRIYSGCYVNGSVDLWAQNNTAGKGIRADLLGVQFARDGDAFSGGKQGSVSDFEELAAGASADSLA